MRASYPFPNGRRCGRFIRLIEIILVKKIYGPCAINSYSNPTVNKCKNM